MPCPPRARSVAHMAPCIADRGHLPPRPPFCSACVCARPYVDIYARPRRRCRARGSSSIDHAVCARHVPRRLTMYACAWSHGDRITRMRTLLYVRVMWPKPYWSPRIQLFIIQMGRTKPWAYLDRLFSKNMAMERS